eukprot:14690235-Ditylum_brightwellii.AAC.1
MDDCLVVKEQASKEDWKVWASLRLSKKPVSSQEYICKEDCLVAKEHTYKEDWEVWASLHLSKKPVSSQENTCMDN